MKKLNCHVRGAQTPAESAWVCRMEAFKLGDDIVSARITSESPTDTRTSCPKQRGGPPTLVSGADQTSFAPPEGENVVVATTKGPQRQSSRAVAFFREGALAGVVDHGNRTALRSIVSFLIEYHACNVIYSISICCI